MGRRFLTVVALGAALLGACGDDDKKPAKDAGMDSGMDSGGGTAGTKADSATPPDMIMCDAKQCTTPEVMLPDGFMVMGIPVTPELLVSFGYGPQVCCAGDGEDICGVTQPTLIPSGECLEQNQLGRPSSEAECPAPEQGLSVMGFELPLTTCCRADDKCGIDLGILGVGCLENTELTRIGMMGGAMTDAAPPMFDAKACTYELTSNDGGAEDAGH